VWDLLAQAVEPGGLSDVIDRLARTPLSKVVTFVAVCTVIRVALHFYLIRVPRHLRTGGYSFAKFLNEALDAIIYAGVFVFLLIRPFGVQTFRIPTGSMLHTLQISDAIVANKAIYRYSDPQFQDIVVFKAPPGAILGPATEMDYIKRCVGIPGDVVEIRDNVLYRNGQVIEEPYAQFMDGRNTPLSPAQKAMAAHDFKLVQDGDRIVPLLIRGDLVNDPTTMSQFGVHSTIEMERLRSLPAAAVPRGYYLMIGDNRFNSYDSRFWGLVPRQDIIGRSEFIWFPPGRWGSTR
jgi:signal peptidase I